MLQVGARKEKKKKEEEKQINNPPTHTLGISEHEGKVGHGWMEESAEWFVIFQVNSLAQS